MTYRISAGSAQPKSQPVHSKSQWLNWPAPPFHSFWDLLKTKSVNKKGPETPASQNQLFRT